MKQKLILFLIGVSFGFIMIYSEAASWFRIYEMFRFKSFHMYGIIGTAVILGILIHYYIKSTQAKTFSGDEIVIKPKEKAFKRNLFGGLIFGLGWALSGACPGPIYVLLGSGFVSIIVLLLGAVLGAFVYGLVRSKLPH